MSFLCETCKQVLKTKKTLSRHIASQHTLPVQPGLSPGPGKVPGPGPGPGVAPGPGPNPGSQPRDLVLMSQAEKLTELAAGTGNVYTCQDCGGPISWLQSPCPGCGKNLNWSGL